KGLSLIAADGEGTASRRLPNVLLVVVVLAVDGDAVGDQVRAVKTDTELTNHGEVGLAGLDGLHEPTCAGASDRTQVVDQISLGHANTEILDGEGLGLGVGNQTNLQVRGR